MVAPLPPGPRLPSLAQTVLFAVARYRWIPALRRRYGDVIRLKIFPERDVVQLADLDHVKAVFSGPATTFHAGEGNMILKPVMGEHSVLQTDEDEHLRARKLLMPPFNGAALKGYRAMVTELAAAEVDRWPTNKPFPVHYRMHALTLEVILRVVFGVAEGPRLEALRAELRKVADVSVLAVFAIHNPWLQRIGKWRQIAEAQDRADALLYAEIAERRQAPDLAERADVLSRLLTVPAGNDRLSDLELRDQLVTLLLAGHETTATALAWAFHELARHPALLDRTVRAADEGDEKYLEAVIKESMRLHPVIGEVARKLTEEVEIGGYRIPAGYTVQPSINVVQHDPAHHDDPYMFRPERFLDGGPPQGSWFPFGGGVRRCIGAGFSLMEATAVLREVFTRYRIAPDRPRPERPKPKHITMVPSRGARIVISPRS